MYRNLRLLTNCIQRFGLLTGCRLFLLFKLKRFNNVRIPGVQSGISLRKGTTDDNTFAQVYLKEEYKTVINESSQLFKKDDPLVIIDGGANIGLFTLYIKNHFTNATVICIEPDPENFQQLKQNVSTYKNVYCENAGLWIKDTKLKVYDKHNFGKWGLVVEENLKEGNIQAVSINSLLTKHDLKRIDILKLDIETSEKILFSDNYQQWLPITKMVVVELHDWMEEGTSRPFFEAIHKTFRKYKYSISGENTVIVNLDME